MFLDNKDDKHRLDDVSMTEDKCENGSCVKQQNPSNIDKENIKQKINSDCGCNANNQDAVVDKGSSSSLSTSHYIKFLEEQIRILDQKLKVLNEEYNNAKLRFQADLDNFSKRMNKEKTNLLKYASMNLIEKILVPFEQFDKVLENTSSQEESVKNFLMGFQMIHKQIKNIFQEEGMKEIPALGEIFNPNIHYALEKIIDKNSPNNTNISVLQKGYYFKERVLKPAMVKVNEWSDKNGENK